MSARLVNSSPKGVGQQRSDMTSVVDAGLFRYKAEHMDSDAATQTGGTRPHHRPLSARVTSPRNQLANLSIAAPSPSTLVR